MKFIKENWHKHAGYSAIIAIFWNLIFIEKTYSPFVAGIEAAVLLCMIGVIWEGYHRSVNGSKFDYRDIIANMVGAFIAAFLYHLIF